MVFRWVNHFLWVNHIRIHHECEGGIGKSVLRITIWHHEASPFGWIIPCYPTCICTMFQASVIVAELEYFSCTDSFRSVSILLSIYKHNILVIIGEQINNLLLTISRGQKFQSSARNYEWNLDRGRITWGRHITYYSLMFFITYTLMDKCMCLQDEWIL